MMNVVRGLIGVIIGLVLIVIGLSPAISCVLIRILGGQCISFFVNLLVDRAFSIVPTILLGMGALFILDWSITPARGARK